MSDTKSRWLAISIFMIFAVASGCGRPDPADTVKKFSLALTERRYDDAVECAPKSLQQMLEARDPLTGVSRKALLFNEWDKSTADAPHIKKFVVVDEHIDGNRATVKYEIQYAKGGVEKGKDNLVWEDGAWRMIFSD